MIGVILASHGKLADGMMDSCRLFFGREIPNMMSLCLMPEDSPDQYKSELEKAIQKTDTGQGVVVFCDLLFGTPCNCCAGEISSNVKVICGMNLPVVLEFLGMRSAAVEEKTPCLTEINWQGLIKKGSEGICDLEKMLTEEKE